MYVIMAESAMSTTKKGNLERYSLRLQMYMDINQAI